jgi:hypothetical protein
VAEGLVVAGVALVLAVVMTWPFVLSLDHRAHDRIDPLFQAWTIDWVQHALGSDDRLWDANIFAPNARTLTYSDSLLGLSVLLLPARWAGLSPIGVHNVGVLLAYAASAVAGYVFGRVATRSVVVGACTGVVYAFGTYNAFLAQHLQVLFHPGPALAAAAMWRLADRCDERRSLWPSLVALTAVIAVQGTVSVYTLAITLVAAATVALVRVRALGRTGLLAAGGAVGAAAVLLLPALWPYVQTRGVRSSGYDLAAFGLSGADFLATGERSTFWGSTLGASLATQPTFPGLVLPALAGVGLLRGRVRAHRQVIVGAVCLVVAGAVVAVGTSDGGWRQFAPYRLVYELVPGGDALRATARFWLVGLLGLGVLAGLGVEHLRSRVLASTRRPVLGALTAAGCCVALLVEGHASWTGLPEIEIPAADEVLAAMPQEGGVLYLPVDVDGFGRFHQAEIVYRTTAHHRKTPNGYSGTTPDSFRALEDRVASLPAPAAIEHVRGLGVRYIVLLEDGGAWEHLRDPDEADPLRVIGEFGGELLLEVPGTR